ncbi:hypothetical protein [Streptomyces cavernicola]|uniref:Uncharacterized protein n=1 Tax=Streptomyces cavernicola TaxID=3043613 RepID=A0ABT6SAT7_9ACTN|nr:hypothetical protein [Streptomyces sp. B-S-A6]MDI3405069.1 hypothetical protein [Streptomyces sp. B-S-A6]
MHTDHVARGPQVRVGITAVASALPAAEVSSYDLQEQVTAAAGLRLPARMLQRATGIDTRRVAGRREPHGGLPRGGRLGAGGLQHRRPHSVRPRRAIRTVLRAHGVRARIRHLPLPAARTAGRAAETLARLRPRTEPVLTCYAVAQLAHPVVLDVTKAEAQGWTAVRELAEYAR